jgi:hypothetical protein
MNICVALMRVTLGLKRGTGRGWYGPPRTMQLEFTDSKSDTRPSLNFYWSHKDFKHKSWKPDHRMDRQRAADSCVWAYS